MATFGTQNIKFWSIENEDIQGEYGEFNEQGKLTSFACGTYDDEEGIFYSGGANTLIYVWKDSKLYKTVKLHDSGFISCLKYS